MPSAMLNARTTATQRPHDPLRNRLTKAEGELRARRGAAAVPVAIGSFLHVSGASGRHPFCRRLDGGD
jgi:hypothetical protein